MRDFLKNWRLRVAQYLLVGSDYSVCNTAEVHQLRGKVSSMIMYAHTSGGLNDPRRIAAKRKVLRYGEAINDGIGRVLVQ
jgi:hypothetical protein